MSKSLDTSASRGHCHPVLYSYGLLLPMLGKQQTLLAEHRENELLYA